MSAHSPRARLSASAAQRLIVLLAAACLVAAEARAAGITVATDRPEISAEEELLLVVTVEGSQTAEPRLPQLPDFDVRPRGASRSLQFVNGRVSSTATYRYALLPRRAGEFTIGAAQVEIAGRVYASQPFAVRVRHASDGPAPGAARDLFVTAGVSADTPWVGQQVIYVWRFYRGVPVADARMEPDAFEGFEVEELGEVRQSDGVVEGRPYTIRELRLALFPQRPGRLTIPGLRLACEVPLPAPVHGGDLMDQVFGGLVTRTRVLRAPALELDVRPLPPSPRDFSGLVGDFGIESALSRSAVRVGESTTLEVRIHGTGNVRRIGEPAFPELESFKVYSESPAERVDPTAQGLAGRKSFRRALVPLSPGERILPALRLVFFDPSAGSFRSAQSEPLKLTVAPAAGSAAAGPVAPAPAARAAAQRPAPELATGPAPAPAEAPARVPERLATLAAGSLARLRMVPRSTLALVLLALPLAAVALVLAGAAARRAHRRFVEPERSRRRSALRRALTGASAAARRAAAGDPVAAAEASRCLRRYVGDRMGCEGAALTAVEAGSLLARSGVNDELAERARSLLARLDAAQFGGAVVARDELPVGSETELTRLLQDLDGSLARRRGGAPGGAHHAEHGRAARA